ncbi:TIGR00730 family Rossman fold protein [Aquibium sp. A9E412]|uniref:LOG family protein n=1 Tax=Aquibium sp. A9E412 TaxID=2976767 RepID=UPI0025B008A8|nr:TIGR00730 family Rossman fold protein [Aquibium sp. A9E412]MDN2567173.1 TIGR00730 family Rossman fold protein [Aquibium sp. A9E412]
MTPISSICVYCGSSAGRDQTYSDAGRTLGRALADNGLRLVYGGGTKGIMGAVAEGCLASGGKVTGIIPRFLMAKEATAEALEHLDDLIVTEDMHTRKHRMFEESDAFVALPGGIGTVEEIVEIMTWAQLGRHRKPIVFANIAGFWDPFLTLMSHMREQGFIHSSRLVRPIVVDSAEAIVPAVIEAAGRRGAPAGGREEVIERL